MVILQLVLAVIVYKLMGLTFALTLDKAFFYFKYRNALSYLKSHHTTFAVAYGVISLVCLLLMVVVACAFVCLLSYV